MLRFDKAKFTLPILFGSITSDEVMSQLTKFSSKKFNLDLPIHAYYGSMNCVWNAGRPNQYNTNTI